MEKTMDDVEKDNGMLNMELFEDGDDDLADLEASTEERRLQRDISELYVSGQIPSKRRNLHLSDIIGRTMCPRKMVLLHCYEQDALIHGHMLTARFETGNAIHARWQANLSRAIPGSMVELKHVEKFWKLLFTPDLIAPFRGKLHIWEFKGYKDKTFRGLTLGKKLPKDAILQNTFYQWFTGVHNGLVIVENKDTQDFYAWFIPYNEKLVTPYETVFNQIAGLVKMHQETGHLPERLLGCTSVADDIPKGCASCTACFASKEARVGMRLPEAWE